MRWFKHYSDQHRGRTMQFLFDKYGHKSMTYYILLELCADKLEKTKDETVTESDCVFYFHERTLTQNMRINRKVLEQLLNSFSELSLLSFEISKKEIKISMPMLLNLLEKNFKKRPKLGLTKDSRIPLDIDRDKDLDIDRDKEYNSTEPQKAVAVVDVKKTEIDLSFKKVLINKELINSWADTYPKEFLEMELKKLRSWVLANQHKAPKSNWGRFFNSWFDRGWENYRKTLKSEPTKISAEDLEKSINKGDSW